MCKRVCNKNRPMITVMCDYCADGLWYNGGSIETTSSKLPRSFRLLTKRINRWQEEYHRIMFKFDKDPFPSRFEYKKMQKTKEYNRWLREGRKIAEQVRKLAPGKFSVEYFNETTLEREFLPKNKQKKPFKRKEIVRARSYI